MQQKPLFIGTSITYSDDFNLVKEFKDSRFTFQFPSEESFGHVQLDDEHLEWYGAMDYKVK